MSSWVQASRTHLRVLPDRFIAPRFARPAHQLEQLATYCDYVCRKRNHSYGEKRFGSFQSMPSPWHDAVNELLRGHPEVVAEILRDCAGLDTPADLPAEIGSPQFNDRPSADFFADTVVLMAGPVHDPAFGVIVEAQQDKNESKVRQLPRYAAALWLQIRKPVEILVLCREQGVADWYARPISLGLRGCSCLPVVVGPREIPAVTDTERMVANPTLGTLSFAMHGGNPPVATAFAAALPLLSAADAPKYYELAYRMSSSTLRQILEEIVAAETWPVYSPFAKKHFGLGEASGEAKAILLVLESRGLQVTPQQRARITNCTDLDQLSEWATRAAHVTETDDLLR